MKKKVVKKSKKLENVYVNFVLDETGSMDIVRDSTISGFNEYIKTLKKDAKGPILFTLTKFNSEKITVVVLSRGGP